MESFVVLSTKTPCLFIVNANKRNGMHGQNKSVHFKWVPKSKRLVSSTPRHPPLGFEASKKNENIGMKAPAQLKKKSNSSPSSETSVESTSPEITLPEPAANSVFMNHVAMLVRLVDSVDIVELEVKQQGCEVVIRKKEAVSASASCIINEP